MHFLYNIALFISHRSSNIRSPIVLNHYTLANSTVMNTSLRSFLHASLTFSHLVPDIFFNTLSSNTLKSYYSITTNFLSNQSQRL